MAEAAGFVLAVVPICIGVVEKYADVAKLLQRFRNYSDEALYVSQAVNIQKTICRNAIRILLSTIVPDDEAQAMLSDPAHPRWSEASVDQKIDERLGDSRDAFIDAASAVKIKLAMLETFGRECRSQVSQAEKGEPTVAKSKKSGIRARIKFAFSQSEIELLITTVSRLTQEMQTLIQQTEVTPKQRAVPQPSPATKKVIAKFNTVKWAAGSLYQALSCACTVHTEHQARLSLQAVHNLPSQIEFTLAMSSRRLHPNLMSLIDEHGFWLTVESVVSGPSNSSQPLRTLKAAERPPKRERDDTASDLAESNVQSISKMVKTEGASTSTVLQTVAISPVTQTDPSDPLPNFCAKENFCAQLHRLSKQPESSRPTCVGYLELTGCSKHVVYLKSATDIVTSATTSPMIALTDLFTPEYQARSPSEGLALQDRVSIAKQLAMATLQFQATPWLDKPWTSKEVLILEVCEDSTERLDVDNNGIFLNTSIRKSIENPALKTDSSSRNLVRNQLLFNLGVMMLELAFQKPLAELRRAQDIDRDRDLNTDYFTAERVRRQASARLGPRYAEAVRKCIQCDFGSDNDLNQVKLQESFYQNVICELEALENTFRELRLKS